MESFFVSQFYEISHLLVLLKIILDELGRFELKNKLSSDLPDLQEG